MSASRSSRSHLALQAAQSSSYGDICTWKGEVESLLSMGQWSARVDGCSLIGFTDTLSVCACRQESMVAALQDSLTHITFAVKYTAFRFEMRMICVRIVKIQRKFTQADPTAERLQAHREGLWVLECGLLYRDWR